MENHLFIKLTRPQIPIINFLDIWVRKLYHTDSTLEKFKNDTTACLDCALAIMKENNVQKKKTFH